MDTKEDKNIVGVDTVKKNKFRINKKIILISLISLILICLLIGVIIFFIVKIPSKYYGTYTRYYYINGDETKISYKISALSIEQTHDYTFNEEKIIEKESIDYSKKGDDLIIHFEDNDKYILLEDDLLYIESSKDISTSKELGLFYWSEDSTNSDLYEIENKSEGLEDSIETAVNLWTREIIYNVIDQEMEELDFYIFSSEKETDKTDLNTYEIILDAAGGELSLYYDRKTKSLERIYFSGSLLISEYGGVDVDSMDIENLYDCRALLLASMYVLGNSDNIELNQDIEDSDNFVEILEDATYRTIVAEEYDELFNNETIDEDYPDKSSYSLSNEKYNISFTDWISSTSYSISGIISWSISLN